MSEPKNLCTRCGKEVTNLCIGCGKETRNIEFCSIKCRNKFKQKIATKK